MDGSYCCGGVTVGGAAVAGVTVGGVTVGSVTVGGRNCRRQLRPRCGMNTHDEVNFRE